MTDEPTAPSVERVMQRRVGYLLLASLIGYLAGIPFHLALVKEVGRSAIEPVKVAESIIYSVVGGMLVSALAINVGLRAGSRVGLVAFMLSGWDDCSRRVSVAARTCAIAAGLGVLAGVIAVILPMAVMQQFQEEQISLPAWRRFLVSIKAGINEEILCRLGLMSSLAWLIVRTRRTTPSTMAVWIANFLAAIGFAALHLPQAAVFYGLSAPVIIVVMAGNGLPGLVFGWLFWKRGLIAAMTAHLSADLFVYVILPALGM